MHDGVNFIYAFKNDEGKTQQLMKGKHNNCKTISYSTGFSINSYLGTNSSS